MKKTFVLTLALFLGSLAFGATSALAQYCGNAACEGGEEVWTCPQDCPRTGCGDGYCNIAAGEVGSCAADCVCNCAPAQDGPSGSRCVSPALSDGDTGIAGTCDEEGACTTSCAGGTVTFPVNNCNPFEDCSGGTNGSGSTQCTYQATTHGQINVGALPGCAEVGSCTIVSCTDGTAAINNACAPFAGCPATTISSCVLPARAHGISAGGCSEGGACDYTCNNGTWNANINTCVPFASCPAQTISSCVLPLTAHGGNAGGCSAAGACNYSCNDGTWNINNNSCGAFSNCSAGSSGSGQTVCSFPATNHGDAGITGTCNFNGSCTVSCTNGTPTASNSCICHLCNCGNGSIQSAEGEVCDTNGPNVGGNTCASEGQGTGTLGCLGCETYDYSGCTGDLCWKKLSTDEGESGDCTGGPANCPISPTINTNCNAHGEQTCKASCSNIAGPAREFDRWECSPGCDATSFPLNVWVYYIDDQGDNEFCIFNYSSQVCKDDFTLPNPSGPHVGESSPDLCVNSFESHITSACNTQAAGCTISWTPDWPNFRARYPATNSFTLSLIPASLDVFTIDCAAASGGLCANQGGYCSTSGAYFIQTCPSGGSPSVPYDCAAPTVCCL